MDANVVTRLAEANVLVVGDVMLDRFVAGRVTRVSREAPVPVLKFGAARAYPGGASNVAANALAYGGAVTLVGLTGDDDAGRELTASLPRLSPAERSASSPMPAGRRRSRRAISAAGTSSCASMPRRHAGRRRRSATG